MGWSVAISAISTLVSTAGAYQQQEVANNNIAYQNAVNRNAAIAARNDANFQAQVARNNAVIAQQNATAIRERGVVAEQNKKLAGIRVGGAVRARQAALGFLAADTEDSTNVGLFADIAAATQMDIINLRNIAENAARNAEIEGVNFQAQAGLFDLKADSVLSRVAQNQGGSAAGAAAAAFFSGAAQTASLI